MAKDLSWTKMQVETVDFFHGIWGVPVKIALKPGHFIVTLWWTNIAIENGHL